MPEVNKLHVVTYVWHPGEKEPDVAAHQVLSIPADPKTGVEGDASKAVLSKAENFQCNGEHGTDGCTKCHPHAEERVIARLIENDRVAVAWRKYHPLAAKGTVQPGKPFEAEHEGVKVRVEARVVTGEDSDVLTNKAVSMVGLRNLEANLKVQQARGQLREQMRQQVDAFATGTFNPAHAAFDALAEKTKDLPGAEAIIKPAREAFDQILQDARDAYLALANDAALDANKAAQLPVQLQAIGQRIAAANQPVQKLEANGRALAAAQAGLRAALENLEAIDAAAARSKVDLPGLDLEKLVHKDAAAQGQALLAKSRVDATITPEAINKEAAALTVAHDVANNALDALIAGERKKLDAFGARLDVFKQLNDGSLKATLIDYVESCGAAEGFNTKHWLTVIEKAVDAVAGKAVDPGALSYHRPADEKKLAAAEAKIAPLTKAIADLDADVKKRIDPYPSIAIGAQQLVPPSAWVKVDAVHDDGTVDVSVHVRNNGAHALVVDVADGEGDPLGRFAFGARGEHGVLKLEGVGKTFGFSIQGIGAQAERGTRAKLAACEVHAASIPLEGLGSIRHVLPLHFTAAPQQPGGSIAADLVDDDVRYNVQRVAGG